MTADTNRVTNSTVGFMRSWFVRLGNRNQQLILSGRFHIVLLLLTTILLAAGIVVVSLFGSDSEVHNWLLQHIHWIHLSITLAVAGLAFLIWRELLDPMLRLCHWADLMRGINLNATVHFQKDSDFLELQDDINMLGNMIDQLSRDTEIQLQKHTDHISQKTRSLAILYDIASTISASSDLSDVFAHSLQSLCRNLGAQGGFIRQMSGSGDTPRIVKQFGDVDVSVERIIDSSKSNYTDIFTCELDRLTPSAAKYLVSIPINYRSICSGSICLFFSPDNMINLDEYKSLLNSIGQHLGTAVEKYRLHEEENQLLVVQERTRLSHELHDSLAQTLASLRIQARLLDDTIQTTQDKNVWTQLERIEYTIEEANDELRNLIAHFRVPSNQCDFLSSVRSVIDSFQQDTGVNVFFQNEWSITELPAKIETHVLRIIQECFANIRKHSNATRVRLLLRSDRTGRSHHIFIEDDGVGFDKSTIEDSTDGHFGLSILLDRANEIDGNINIESEPGEGTQVTLNFSYPKNSTNNSSILLQEKTGSG